MTKYIKKDEQYVGEVLPGQGWVELKGIFTIGELESIMDNIMANYRKIDNDDTQRHRPND